MVKFRENEGEYMCFALWWNLLENMNMRYSDFCLKQEGVMVLLVQFDH
jgi:hypothetical protein